MADEISPLTSTSSSYTVGSPPDEDRREKTKKPIKPNENDNSEIEQEQEEKKQNGLFDEFV